METKPGSRKFPIILYDLREVDNIRVFFRTVDQNKEDNAELKQVNLSTIVSTTSAFSDEDMDELPVVDEEAKSISLSEAGRLQVSNKSMQSLFPFIKQGE